MLHKSMTWIHWLDDCSQQVHVHRSNGHDCPIGVGGRHLNCLEFAHTCNMYNNCLCVHVYDPSVSFTEWSHFLRFYLLLLYHGRLQNFLITTKSMTKTVRHMYETPLLDFYLSFFGWSYHILYWLCLVLLTPFECLGYALQETCIPNSVRRSPLRRWVYCYMLSDTIHEGQLSIYDYHMNLNAPWDPPNSEFEFELDFVRSSKFWVWNWAALSVTVSLHFVTFCCTFWLSQLFF